MKSLYLPVFAGARAALSTCGPPRSKFLSVLALCFVCICLTPSCTTQNTQRRAEEHKIHTNLDQQLWQQCLTNKLQLGQQKLTEAINAEKRREQKKHAEQVQESLLAVGEKMNFADQYLEEYGSSSISVPLLAKLGEDFTFNLKQGGTNYYNDAKTQVQEI